MESEHEMADYSKRDRLQAVISGERADRPPVALWRHFPVDDQDPWALAEATGDFQDRYDFDFIKVTPSSSFCLRDWGVEDEWRGSTEGVREYTQRVIENVEDWRSLRPLQAEAPALRAQLECLAALRERYGDRVPFIQTIFNPLSQAKNLAGSERLKEHLHRDPAAVEAGLETITTTTLDFIAAAKERGIAGIFYAIQHASYTHFDPQGYERFGLRYDARLMEATESLWLNVLHLHGEALIFEVASELPAQIVNWHDRAAGPNLAEGKSVISGAVCGGIQQWDAMVVGTPDLVRQQALSALQSMHDRMVLGTGCVVPIVAPHGNIDAVRKAVDHS
jgi:uroporphyrinogen decarboxylase